MEKKTLLNKKCDQQQKLNGYNGVWKGGSGWQKKNQKGGILLKGMGGEKMESGSSTSFQMFEYNYALTQRVITSLVLASAAAIKGWRVFVVVGAKKESFLPKNGAEIWIWKMKSQKMTLEYFEIMK